MLDAQGLRDGKTQWAGIGKRATRMERERAGAQGRDSVDDSPAGRRADVPDLRIGAEPPSAENRLRLDPDKGSPGRQAAEGALGHAAQQ